jgi:hypothetical protein
MSIEGSRNWLSVAFEAPTEGADRLGRLRAALDEYGIKVQGGSRLAQYAVLADRFARGELTAQAELSDLKRLITAYRDFGELALAVNSLLPSDDPMVAVKFRQALSGAATAEADTKPLARNTQFELFVAALLKHYGYAALFREPDIVCPIGPHEMGIAAKRITSEAQFARRVREAGKQMKRASLSGIVAVSIEELLPEEQQFQVADRMDDLLASTPQLAVNPMDARKDQTLKAVSGLPVLALLAVVVVPCVIRSERRIGHSISMLMRGIHSHCSQSQYEALIALSETLGRQAPPI